MSVHSYLKWLSHQTASIYWHDSAIRAEQLDAFSNGAVGMTTNPFWFTTRYPPIGHFGRKSWTHCRKACRVWKKFTH